MCGGCVRGSALGARRDRRDCRVGEASQPEERRGWLATEVEYGEANTVQFTSSRQNYAAIESGTTAFFGAIKEAYGPQGVFRK